MEIHLIRATIKDAKNIYKMQQKAFKKLYIKYQDTNSPYNETFRKIKLKLTQDSVYAYIIQYDNSSVGAIIIFDNDIKVLYRLFVLPEYQNKGIAQETIRQIEEIHGKDNWQLDTILQENANCHLYEKMGYRQTGKTKIINNDLTIVFYEK